MTDTIESLAEESPDILELQLKRIGHLAEWARKQTLEQPGCTMEFADSYASCATGIAAIEDLRSRFIEARRHSREAEAVEISAETDDAAPDFDALHKINPLIECDLFETRDSATDMLEFLSGMLVQDSVREMLGSDERCGGVVHQIDTIRAAIDFVADEVRKQIHGPVRICSTGGAA